MTKSKINSSLNGNQDKFSYYLNDDNTLKSMNDYQALKLDKNSFMALDETQLKKHIKKLYFEFHPDQNLEYKSRSEITFVKIMTSAEVLINKKKQQKHMNDKNRVDSVLSSKNSRKYVEDWLKEKLDLLDFLSYQVDVISGKQDSTENSMPFPLVTTEGNIVCNTFQDILKQLYINWKGTLAHSEEINKQYEVFDKLSLSAKEATKERGR